MDLNFNRKTRFPSIEQGRSTETAENEKSINPNRRTRFPGGTETEKIRLLDKEEQRNRTSPDKKQLNLPPFRLPINSDQQELLVVKTVPETTLKTLGKDILPAIRVGSPWNAYISLRNLERGGKVTVAYTRKLPVRVVVVQELVSDNFIELRKCQHENLLTIAAVYRFQSALFVITDYTATTLKQIIAIPLPLEELHVSATCRQIFEGMQHLSRFGMCHNKLDSSKVLFSADGCVKLAHFDECRVTESAGARSLGIIAIEMMQNGIPPSEDARLGLNHPDRWTPEASNFLEVTSWGTLMEVEKHRFLTYVSPSVMIPFIYYAGWDTLESLSLKILD